MKIDIRFLLEEFCTEGKILGNLQDATILWYQRSISIFLRKMPHVKRLDDFNTENIRSFLYNGRLNRNWKVKTFVNYHGAFRGFLNWCVRRKYLKENPATAVEVPRKEKTLPRSITKQDAEKLLDHAFHQKTQYRYERYRDRALLAIMILAGLRVKEVLNLKLHDVDFENGVIFVAHGKGAKDRVVPMCSKLKRYLKEYAEERVRLKRLSPFFITSLRRDMPLTYPGLQKIILRIRSESGIRFTCHGLRHTFATLMVEGGCNIYALSKMLGHSDIQTTTIYLSASAEHLKEQIVKHPLNF